MDLIQTDEEKRRKKTKLQAQMFAFTSQLFYFTIKALVCFVLFKYKNILWENPTYILIFVVFLLINTYFILTTGKDPGFEPVRTSHDEQGSILMNEDVNLENNHKKTDQNQCQICLCPKKNRMKHCYCCGRCVRKYDHHCPWIGACVGQKNHMKFVMMTFFQTLQALFTFYIVFKSLDMYEYKEEDGSYGQQYGVFSLFTGFMVLYVIFVAGLFFFHFYLILSNITTKQLISRQKLPYLKGIKGNPFSKGPWKNLIMAIDIPPEGHSWQLNLSRTGKQRSFWSRIWENEYYSCC